jgi:AraC-like DNA-binding protein
MKNTNGVNQFVESPNKALLDELCLWIDNNLNNEIGWAELVSESKLTHSELQFLFSKYLKITPMTYIRRRREENKKTSYFEKMISKPSLVKK